MGLIVVSNREPYAPVRQEGGPLEWVPSIGGLTAALDPALQRLGGTWIAWGEQQTQIKRVELPPQEPRYTLERVKLSEQEVRDFYYGFSNRALWPVSHYFIGRALFLRSGWRAYVEVNRRFAEAAVRRYREGDLIWVHDYQLALVPQMIREALPQARIGFFWHIPWPSSEVWRTVPWAAELLRGILGADLVGMHTSEYVRHFGSACVRVLGTEVWGEGTSVRLDGRRTKVQARPIGIETEVFEELAGRPEVQDAARRIKAGLQTAVLLGVDRLDYTKGIPERLEAFDAFLDEYPEVRERVTLLQVSVPSRERVESYRQLRTQVEGLVGRINGKHARNGWSPIHYVYRGLSREELVAHYRAADVMLVTPLRDGLNLVAKEFVACSEEGALILSVFAGAAHEMQGAILVNPYDHDGLAAKLLEALEMPKEEKRARLEGMQAQLREHDLKRWAEGFLGELEAS